MPKDPGTYTFPAVDLAQGGSSAYSYMEQDDRLHLHQVKDITIKASLINQMGEYSR